MTSPELASIIDMLNSNPIPRDADIPTLRQAMLALTTAAPLPSDIRYEPDSLGPVAVEWAVPTNAAPESVICYLHGGGYCLGSVATHRTLVGAIARAACARVVSVDYRLAPEHPFPAAIEDATTAYRALLARGVAPSRVALAGDSAGGGLTIAALLALRDSTTPLPAAAACISPWLDLTCSGESMTTRASVDPMLQRGPALKLAAAYLDGADAATPLASPLFADPAGLPPILLHVGTAEVLLDDSTRFGERARSAGVDVTLEVWPDMIHVWHAFAPLLPEADRAIERVGDYLGARLSSKRVT